MIALPDRLQRPVKWVGYPLFAFVVFLLALYLSLPKDRIEDLLENSASTFLNAKVRADRDEFGLTLFSGPGVTASNVLVTMTPPNPNDKPVNYKVDDLTVHFSLWQLFHGFADTSFSGHIAGGEVSGKYKSVPDEGVVSLDASGLSVGSLPIISAPGGIPIDGKIDLKIDLNSPKNLIPQTNGSVSVTINDATLGDGKAKLTIPGGDPFLAQGVTIPKISLGKLTGSVNVEKGKATFREVRGHSKDVDIELEGYIELRDPLILSVMHAYLKFKPSDALIKREPTIELMNNMVLTAKRPDGYLGFSLTGVLSSLATLPSRDPPAGVMPTGPGVAQHGGVTPPPPIAPLRTGNITPPPPSVTNIEVPSAPAPLPPPPSLPPPPAAAAPENTTPPPVPTAVGQPGTVGTVAPRFGAPGGLRGVIDSANPPGAAGPAGGPTTGGTTPPGNPEEPKGEPPPEVMVQ
jgi:type II secretion system protein N